MANTKIKDQFTKLKVSRQRKWQLRQMAKGGCYLCAEPRVTATHCLKHAIEQRERERKAGGFRTRKNSLTYRLSKAGKGAK